MCNFSIFSKIQRLKVEKHKRLCEHRKQGKHRCGYLERTAKGGKSKTSAKQKSWRRDIHFLNEAIVWRTKRLNRSLKNDELDALVIFVRSRFQPYGTREWRTRIKIFLACWNWCLYRLGGVEGWSICTSKTISFAGANQFFNKKPNPTSDSGLNDCRRKGCGSMT